MITNNNLSVLKPEGDCPQTKANSPLEQNANTGPDSGKSQNIVKVHVETKAVRPIAEAPKSPFLIGWAQAAVPLIMCAPITKVNTTQRKH